MSLDLFLYKENELIFSIKKQEYFLDNKDIIFSFANDNYRLNISPENFIFTKENKEQKFCINYQKKTYTYLLKAYNKSLNINCSFQKYQYHKNKVEYEYIIESDEKSNKIIIELESSD